MRKILKKLLPLGISFGLVLSIYLITSNPKIIPFSEKFLHYLSYFTFVIALFLSYWFNRSRIFFIALTLLVVQLALGLKTGTLEPLEKAFLDRAITILLPFNLILFSFVKERGIFSLWGKLRIGFILLQIYLVGLYMFSADSKIFLFLTRLNWTKTAVIAFSIALVFFIARELFRPASGQNSVLVGMLTASFLSLHTQQAPQEVIMFLISGILLIFSIITVSYSMAYFDELTRIPSRRALQEELLKLSGSYVIAMVDIDHFKGFNDEHGHAVGDEVLRMVATQITNVGGGGKAFRYGGEEFLILFPRKRIEDTLEHLENLRKKIAGKKFVVRAKRKTKRKSKLLPKTISLKKLALTVSIGVAEKNQQHKTFEDVIKAADMALYDAKDKGRNQLRKAKS